MALAVRPTRSWMQQHRAGLADSETAPGSCERCEMLDMRRFGAASGPIRAVIRGARWRVVDAIRTAREEAALSAHFHRLMANVDDARTERSCLDEPRPAIASGATGHPRAAPLSRHLSVD